MGLLPVTLHPTLTMSACRSGRGLLPFRSVGARIHWPTARRELSEHPLLAQPRAAIQRAPGATPTWLPAPSSPTMTPVVCVPCPTSSHGAGLLQAPVGSNQL